MRNRLIFKRVLNTIVAGLNGPSALAFIPALSLAAFWIGGEQVLLIVALGLPLIHAGASAANIWPAIGNSLRDNSGGMMPEQVFRTRLGNLLDGARKNMESSACFVISLDDYGSLLDLHGQAAVAHIAELACSRTLSTIRSQDIVTRDGRDKIALGLGASPHLDLESCIQMSGRIQTAIEEPIMLNGAGLCVSCSIGFCLMPHDFDGDATDGIEAANAALAEAQRNGPSTIRAYSVETRRRSRIRTNLRKDFEAALDNGEIRPWFQPQISTDTGRVTGFEALARWEHPQKGVLGPQAFLPFAQQAELMERLGHAMCHHAFTAMQAWDRAGVVVPRIGINFSSDELRDPGLMDRLKWELDQFDLTPDRLAVEILETVFAKRPDDVITRNVTGMAALGCCIDLDDFGTGHASIASIKRFDVSRIKIDRSFVTKSDRDPGQQQLASAILTMAERLNLETLAEGVETPGEHALMAQLGCNHVQGFGIGKPMPLEQTLDWIASHRAKVNKVPGIGRQTG